MMCTIRRGEERAVGQRQILCRVVVVIRIRVGRTRKAFLIKVSPFLLERETREREKEKREESHQERERIGTIQFTAHSCVVIAQSSKSLTEEFDYNREEKRTKETLQRELLLLLLLTWLGQFTTRKDDDKALLLLGPRVVIFKVFAY